MIIVSFKFVPRFLSSINFKICTIMKKEIHPEYKEVVFQDTSSDFAFLTKSTMSSKETIKWEDGKTYPMIKVEVSSASHPFYTGKKLFVDTAGRVEKFNRKYKKK
jgi:large subunit ribosomal protein L31